MQDQPRRRDDRIFDSSYVDDLEGVALEDLRKRRTECEEYEAELSYTRRLLQGKLDIIRAEIERRAAGGAGGVSGLLDKLAQILGGGNGSSGGVSGNVRHNPIVVPANADNQRREVERLVSDTLLSHIDELSVDELKEVIERLTDAEASASEKRKKVQVVLDGIGEELVKRYREGREDASALLKS